MFSNQSALLDREGHVDILTLLLEHDSNSWTTISKNKRTPLHTAGTQSVSIQTLSVEAIISLTDYAPFPVWSLI